MAETSVITETRRYNLCRASCGEMESFPTVTHMAFGDGGTDEDGEPISPPSTQTELNHEIARYEITSVTHPQPATNAYMARIPAADLPGAVISEIGLINSDGELDIIKNCYPKVKDEGTVFEITIEDIF